MSEKLKFFVLNKFFGWEIGKRNRLYKKGYRDFSPDIMAYKYYFTPGVAWRMQFPKIYRTYLKIMNRI